MASEQRIKFRSFLDAKYPDTYRSGVLSDEKKNLITKYLSNPTSEDVDSKLKHTLKKKKFTLVNGTLCQEKNVAGRVVYLEVPSIGELYDIIDEVHQNTGHDGIYKTHKAIQLRYAYVPRCLVEVYVKSCLNCQLKRPQIRTGPLKPIVSSRPFQRCQIDLINRLQKPDGVYKHIMTYIDHFSKFVILRPLKTKSSIEVATALKESVFSVFGTPSIIQSDNGGEFASLQALIETWPSQHKTKLIHGRPRHPQSQGVVERVNRTIQEKLSIREEELRQDGSKNPAPWTSWLPEIAYQINTGYHSTIGMSPFECVFGRKPGSFQIEDEDILETMPDAPLATDCDEIGESPRSSQCDATGTTDTPQSDDETSIREATQQRAQQFTTRSINRMIRAPHSAVAEYKVGDFVTLHVPKNDRPASGRRRIPAVVVKKTGCDSYRLRCQHGVLRLSYRQDVLQKFDGTLQLTVFGWENDRTLTLREAATRQMTPERYNTNEEIWPTQTAFHLRKLVESNFSEIECELMLDCFALVPWSVQLETARILTDLLPSFPEQLATSFTQLPIGRFGDGYIEFIPKAFRDSYKVALSTGKENNACLYNAASLLLWGNEENSTYLRLASISKGLSEYEETVQMVLENYPESERLRAWLSSATTDVVMAEINGNTDVSALRHVLRKELQMSMNASRDSGPIQCLVLSDVIQRQIRVHSVDGPLPEYLSRTFQGEELDLAIVPTTVSCRGSRLSHFVPLVDGELVGCGEEARLTCGADAFGFCQIKSKTSPGAVVCDFCRQLYHLDCVSINNKNEFTCGCHVVAPIRPKDEGFYSSPRQVKKVIRKVDVKEFVKGIEEGRYASDRQNTKGTRKYMFWKHRSGFHRYSEDVVDLFYSIMNKMGTTQRDNLDVFVPELAVHICMKQEDVNRMEAELILNTSTWLCDSTS